MRLRFRPLFLPFIAVLLSAGPALAQEALSVAGIVLEEEGGTPIADASVLLAGQRVETSGAGMFIITNVAPGDYSLVVEALGYTRYVVDLALRADTTLRILLTPEPVSLEAVVVLLSMQHQLIPPTRGHHVRRRCPVRSIGWSCFVSARRVVRCCRRRS